MKFAFDLDGCVANTLSVILRKIYENFNEKIKVSNIITFKIEECTHLTSSQVVQCVNEAIEGVEGIEAFPGSIEFLRKYYDITREPIIIVTSRPDNHIDCTYKWLEEHCSGIPFDVVCGFDKAGICENLGIEYFVEDRAKFAKELSKIGIKVLLLDRMYNKHAPKLEHIYRVKDWNEINRFFDSNRKINQFNYQQVANRNL